MASGTFHNRTRCGTLRCLPSADLQRSPGQALHTGHVTASLSFRDMSPIFTPR